jgi:oligoendopeptidase F
MTQRTLPTRAEIPPEHTWDATSVFPTAADWDAAYDRIQAALPDLREFRGHLADGPAQVADFYAAAESVLWTLSHLMVYASMFTSVDTNDQEALARTDRGRSLSARVSAALSYAEPELLAIGVDRLNEWTTQDDRLGAYQHHFDRLGRKAVHVRSDDVEEVLSLASEPLQSATSIHGILANGEIPFAAATASDGDQYEVAQGTYAELLGHTDREVRRTAWESYSDAHLALKGTMAACIATGIKRDVFHARVRRYDSCLEAALEPNFIPVEVFHRMLDEFRASLPTWHRYWRLRKRALGLDQQYPFDTRAQLTGARAQVPYEQAVAWICEGLPPLGEEYIDVVRRGALQERWVDIYPNKGKRMGAFSMGAPGTHPFIFMSYNSNLFSLSTLAHELGHSMHSYYSRAAQPFVYANYGLFIAEVASNFHQALVRDHLLARDSDPEFQIGVIEEAMANFHRYFFIMPSLARFELEMHERAERGEALSADLLTQRMYELLEDVYGGEVTYRDDADRARSGSMWAQFHTHLYANFYVYQYATGIAGAHWLADRVLRGEPGASAAYLDFIRAGSSMYPLDALRVAGVDMTSPEPVRKAFAVMAGYVDRLEDLLAARTT